jgi:hypothetical protein
MLGHFKRLFGRPEFRGRFLLLFLSVLALAGAVAALNGHRLASGQALMRVSLPETIARDSQLDPAEAARLKALNLAMPFNPERILPAKPFVLLSATAGSHALSAVDCLTAAVYYEAGYEPLAGQRAVAQVVLNRVRHPAFPDSVCGVVFEGASRATGCQFTFTCDGSLMRTPSKEGWKRAQGVAIAALSGFVEPSVGHATHYHADYVRPYWAERLVKLHAIGAHIFYLWPGNAGNPQAFADKYAGQEVVPISAATGLSFHLLSSATGEAYENAFANPSPEVALNAREADRIPSMLGATVASEPTAPVSDTMLEKGGELRVPQGQLKDDLAAPRRIFVGPNPVPSQK